MEKAHGNAPFLFGMMLRVETTIIFWNWKIESIFLIVGDKSDRTEFRKGAN